jgi:hypothetical protein
MPANKNEVALLSQLILFSYYYAIKRNYCTLGFIFICRTNIAYHFPSCIVRSLLYSITWISVKSTLTLRSVWFINWTLCQICFFEFIRVERGVKFKKHLRGGGERKLRKFGNLWSNRMLGVDSAAPSHLFPAPMKANANTVWCVHVWNFSSGQLDPYRKSVFVPITELFISIDCPHDRWSLLSYIVLATCCCQTAVGAYGTAFVSAALVAWNNFIDEVTVAWSNIAGVRVRRCKQKKLQ